MKRNGEVWGMCARCLTHHPSLLLIERQATYRKAFRDLVLCATCDGRFDRDQWLIKVAGFARYLLQLTGTTLEDAKVKRIVDYHNRITKREDINHDQP